MTDLNLSQETRQRVAAAGEAGARWLDNLPEVVHHLEQVWGLNVSGSLHGGSEALVLDGTRSSGEEVVLKIGLPGSADIEREAGILRIADGRGYVRLIELSVASNAMLVEKLGSPLALVRPVVEDQLACLAETLVVAWSPLAENPGLMTGAEKAAWLADFITRQWQQQAHGCSARVLEQALAFAESRRLAHETSDKVLVHGDPHEFNALEDPGSTTSSFRFIDPDGLYAERAYDLGVVVRGFEVTDGSSTRQFQNAVRTLAEATGVDEQAIREWGFVERVSTGLHLLELDMRDAGRQFLKGAEYLT